ncbi:hypothetical protein [Dapis sp. BLCC M229]|uniref:hypothetical protein n=1 Tax=Dapis sp. BLCC M229 TaxID=3400188 RepID=UPI003CFB3BDD
MSLLETIKTSFGDIPITAFYSQVGILPFRVGSTPCSATLPLTGHTVDFKNPLFG